MWPKDTSSPKFSVCPVNPSTFMSLSFLSMCVCVQMHMYVWVGVHMYAHNCGSLAQLRHNSSGAVHLIFDTGSLTGPWDAIIKARQSGQRGPGIPLQHHNAWLFFFSSKLRTEEQTCTGSIAQTETSSLPHESALKICLIFKQVLHPSSHCSNIWAWPGLTQGGRNSIIT